MIETSRYIQSRFISHSSSTTAHAPAKTPRTMITVLIQLSRFHSCTKPLVLFFSSICILRSYSSLTNAITGSLRSTGGGPMTVYPSSANPTSRPKQHSSAPPIPQGHAKDMKDKLRTAHLNLSSVFVLRSTVSANSGPQPHASADRTYSHRRVPVELYARKP